MESRAVMEKIGNLINQVKMVLFFCLVIMLAGHASAETQVSAEVDRSQIGIGDAFNLVVTVSSDEDFEEKLPVIPKVNGLEELNATVGGRQSSSSMSIVNGKTQFKSQTSQQYVYVYSPQKEGTFIVPVIDVIVAGKTYKTQPVKIEVGEQFRNSRAQKPPKGRPSFPPGFGDDEDTNPFGGTQNEAEDLFDQLLKQQQRLFGNGGSLPQLGGQGGQVPSKKLNINTNDVFFVYLDVDKTEVYEGEQVTANWYIYTRANIQSLDRVKFPDLKGFWKEIIEEVPSLQFTDEIVNGVRYRKALLASHALFPIKSGIAVIDEFKIKAKISTSQNNFSRTTPYDITKVSKRTEIKVLPLPIEGKTVSFSGAVGQYRVSAKTEGFSFSAHQPFSVKIRFEGLGNAKLIDLPQIKWPTGLEIFDSKSEAKFYKEGNSFKEFEVLVIPRQEGALNIPAIELSYFDPSQKKYVTQSTDKINLQITPGLPGAAGAVSAGSVSATSEVSSTAHTQPILIWPSSNFSFSQNRILIYSLLFLFGLLTIGVHAKRSWGQLSFESTSIKLIKNKLKILDRLTQNSEWRLLGAEAVNLIYLIVAQLAGQKKADQELHLLIKEIPIAAQEKYLNQINSLFDYFQLLGFAPDEIMKNVVKQNVMQTQIQQLKQLAQEVVDKITKEDKNNS